MAARFILVIFFVTLFSGTGFALENFSSTGLSKSDEKIAAEAINASMSSDWSRARKIAQEANDVIIYKIILWREFKNARSASSEDIKTFLKYNANWPLRDAFKRRIGLYVPVNNQNDTWRNYASRARDLLESGKSKEAYDLIAGRYQYLSGSNRADALFLCGWIKLRFLKDPAAAAAFFERLYSEVRLPMSRSRGAYWAGRAYEAQGNDGKAYEWYKRGSRHFTIYYGQLSALKIDRNYKLTLPDYPPPDYLDAKNFLSDERVRTAKILDNANDSEDARLFLIKYLDENTRTVSDYLLVVLLAQHTTNYEWAVMAGKKAAEVEVQVPQANYPVLMFEPPAPEKALVMSITRQESQLNRYAKSPVGAVGMMQLMPSTAEHVARQMDKAYSSNMLYNKDYNMTLGSYYLARRIKDFDGSYILAIASYNGGIGNVSTWIKRFGDPRKMSPDQIIDWMELIPFSETRNYVQRVLESTEVYRSRLGGGSHKLELLEDLKR